ncbi:hypothetical protein FSP39_007953 [Pinctada imbricata]|uniref:E3 ubiquitin-protein ligase n=1 Tax=Pinctada imbricata TaxID=66713 RepID=A0AA89C907_PINIB|nr:hypothetical protein FSP39_007953 [Pinctada imbricata]
MINLIRSVFQQNLRGLSVSSSNTTLPSSRKTRSLAGTIRQSDGSTIKTSEEDCCICMDKCTIPKRLGCGHIFCKECIDTQFKYKATCPACGAVFGRLYGDQPPGTMTIYTQSASLPGYPDDGTIEIRYNIPAGKQQENHPTPGAYYEAINRPGFLPDNEKGRLVCKLLNVAFSRKQIFTIGRSRTTGKDGVVTWNDIHHKTRREGGPPRFGYPDPSYLDRVTEELQVKGVTEDTLDDPDEYKEYTRVIKY